MRLLHTSSLEVFQDHLSEGLLLAVAATGFRNVRVNQFVVLIYAEYAVRREALDGERTSHTDFLIVGVGFVVEVFKFGLGGDRGVNFLLPRDACLPPFGMQLLRGVRPLGIGLTRDFPFLPLFLSAAFNFSFNGSSVACHFSQMTSISALLAMDLSVICGTRS